MSAPHNLVYLNGDYLPPEDARISVFDRGFSYGDGVFTTIRVKDGLPLLLELHLERLRRDAVALYLELPPDFEKELAAASVGLVERRSLRDGVLKVTVTRGVGERGPSIPALPRPTVLVTAGGLPPPRPPLRSISVCRERGPLVRHKTLCYLESILALREAELAGCEEAIFRRGDTLLEGTVSTLIHGSGNGLWTPAIERGVLEGVTRHLLIESGAVREGDIPAETSGPLYLVNAVRGVEAVRELDGRPLKQDAAAGNTLREALKRGGGC